MGPEGSVVAATPVSRLEILQGARALAQAGLLARFHAAAPVSSGQEEWAERHLPAPLADPVLRELRRRRPPAEIPEDRIRATATAADLARVALFRAVRAHRVRMAALHRYHRYFDRRVAAALSPDDRAVLAAAGVAGATVARARELGLLTVLDCPIAHHRHMRDITREEAQMNPAWASTLQGHDYPERVIESYEEQIRDADVLLVLSSYARTTMVERGVDPAKMILTPLGVDTDAFHPQPRVADGTFRVAFVGQLSQRKGLSYLIEGFRMANIPGSELVLAGPIVGDDAPWRREPGIQYVGPLPRTAVAELYGRSDVYVLPSLVEGFPLATIEAMASGVPVIVSTHTFGDDVVTDGTDGYVVPIRDAAAVAERLVSLARDPDLRARMGRSARARAEQFTWAKYGERVVDVFSGRLAGTADSVARAR